MFQVDQPTAATSLPTPAAAGAQGYFTGGSPGSGVPATILDADFMNMVMLELTNVVTAAGLTPSKTTYTQVLTAILAMTQSAPRVQGLRGNNNATTPNTQVDFSADSVTLRNPTTGVTNVVMNAGVVTNNILAANTATNGRDQSAAFTASSWVHFYFVWNGTALVTRSSAIAPSAGGPNLQTGEVSWAYIGPMRLSGSSALVPGHFVGAWFNYLVGQAAVSGGTATAITSVSLASVLPPNGMEMKLFVQSLQITGASSGGFSVSLNLQIEASNTIASAGLQGTQQATAVIASVAGAAFVLTQMSQGINYQVLNNAGTAGSVNLAITGYKVANGGE